MKYISNLLLLVFLNSLPGIHSAYACTTISVSNGQTVFFGRNHDQDTSSPHLVVDSSGPYGVIFIAAPWSDHPLVMIEGINEMGLSYAFCWHPTEKLTPHPERKPQDRWAVEAVEYIMKNFSTVDEVLSTIFTYDWGGSIFYQIHFADKYGDAVVIHAGNDNELTFTRKPEGVDYLVTTNFNLAKLYKGTWSCWRYRTAHQMLSKVGDEKDLTVDSMVSIFKATRQPTTLFSFVFDLKLLKIYLFYNSKRVVPFQFKAPYILDVRKELAITNGYRKVSFTDLTSDKAMNIE